MRLPATLAIRGLTGTVLASALLAMPAAAHSRGTATGSFSFLSDTLTPITQADGNSLFNEVAAISYTGGLAGTVHATDLVVIHSDGSINAYGAEACPSCTIGGRTGSFTAVFTLHGSASGVTGTERFVGAAGGLTGLHGGGSFDAGPAGNTYSYDYRFAPPGRRDR